MFRLNLATVPSSVPAGQSGSILWTVKTQAQAVIGRVQAKLRQLAERRRAVRKLVDSLFPPVPARIAAKPKLAVASGNNWRATVRHFALACSLALPSAKAKGRPALFANRRGCCGGTGRIVR
jgi:hypothetical protein